MHPRYHSNLVVDAVDHAAGSAPGKTTSVECVIGLRPPDAGLIRVMGLDPRVDREELHAIVGATDPHLDSANLEDAFVQMTGRHLHEADTGRVHR